MLGVSIVAAVYFCAEPITRRKRSAARRPLVSKALPLAAVSLGEVLQASDIPAGVINMLTGWREELAEQFASHMDVNAVVYCDEDADTARRVQLAAADNIKRVVLRAGLDWNTDESQSPYLIRDTQEIKTTWHPIGA